MSIEAMAIALNHSRATGTAKVVILGIASHDGDGGAWPSIARLARYANVTARNVQNAIRKLEELGEIRVYTQEGGTTATPDHTRPNRYDVLLRCPDTCDGTSQHRTRRPLGGLDPHPLSQSTPPVASDTRPLSPATPELSNNHPLPNRDSYKGSTVTARATVPAAPHVPRYQAPPARATESVSDDQQSMNLAAAQLQCPDGLGTKARHLIPPRTGTACVHCGVAAQTILERQETQE